MGKLYTEKKIFTLKAMSNVHCGTGQGVDDIDLPTAKEAATGFPFVPGSGLKGVLRDYFSNQPDTNDIQAVFGPDFSQQSSEQFASAIMFTDARIIFLPVRSFAGVFAYVTCPLILERFKADLLQVNANKMPDVEIPSVNIEQALLRANGTALMIDGQLLLEDLDLNVSTENSAWENWSNYLLEIFFESDWRNNVADSRLCLVSDDVFTFLCSTSLPVAARIKIDDNGTVKKGGLWYEEYLPAEAILSGMVAATSSMKPGKSDFTGQKILADFATNSLTLQLGGLATTGKGVCTMSFEQGV